MRIAALYDVHGNLPALEAVLDEIRREGVDRIVVGGDVVPGPMAREALERLLSLDVPTTFIRGNCEREMLARSGGSEALPEAVRETLRWSARQFPPEQTRLMSAWPLTVRVQIEKLGEVLFCHGTPRDDNEIFTRLTPEDRLVPIFDGLGADLVVCGHTHMQFDRRIGRTRVMNAGSVGMPFGEPGAYWLMLGADAELRRTPYDLEQAAARIRGSAYPQAGEFAANNVLRPPSEEAILAAFSKAPVRA